MPEIKSCLISACLCRCFTPAANEPSASHKTPVATALTHQPYNSEDKDYPSELNVKPKDSPRFCMRLLGTSVLCGPLDDFAPPNRVLFVNIIAAPATGGSTQTTERVITQQPMANSSASGITGKINPGFINHI